MRSIKLHKTKHGILRCMLTLLCTVTHADITLAQNTQEKDNFIPFSIAISGGISLGSYESGLNWALLKYIKIRRNEITALEPGKLPPQLMSSVGASAGSINALISAIDWCVDDELISQYNSTPAVPIKYTYNNTVDDNLFRAVWLNVGIDQILPADKNVYRQGDGVFTRAAFDNQINQIKDILRSDIFRSNCTIPFGLTVTRVDPLEMSIAGVEIENQRFMIPVRLQSDNSLSSNANISIESNLVNKADPYLGNVIYLRETLQTSQGRYVIDPDHLIEAVLASSAYPIAFSKVRLSNCSSQVSNDYSANIHECPPDTYPRIDDFIDGGVFDNVPLGIAKALAEPSKDDLASRESWEDTARPYNYIYLDPDIRRPIAHTPTSSNQKADASTPTSTDSFNFGVRSHLRFLQGAISTGRNYELYNVLRGGDWTRQTYSFSCKLLYEITGPYDDYPHCKANNEYGNSTCKNLLEGRLDANHKLNKKERKIAAKCLVNEASKLEDIYQGFSGADLPAIKITNIRQKLITRMRLLAIQNGNSQLALSIDTLNSDKFGDRKILLTTRFAPITGDMLGAFGAFIDKPFREYDYYAGVYDAIYGMANFYCQRVHDYQSCLANFTRDIYIKLGIPVFNDANIVFHLLATHEHPDYLQTNSPWFWLNNSTYFPEQHHKGNLAVIFYTLAKNTDPKQDAIYKEPKFVEFIKELFANGYDVTNSSEFMQRTYRLRNKDPSTWYYPITSRVSTRLLELEQGGTDDMSKFIRGTMGIGAFAVHSYIQDEESNLLIKSAAPADSWYNWLPYEIGADFRNGGLVVSWLPGIDLSEKFSLDLKITPVHLNRYGGEAIWFSQFDLFYSYRRQGLISSVGLGPTFSYTWEDWPDAKQNNLGASAYVAFLQDKLRLTVGQRTFDDTFAGEHIYLSISVMDIPGLTYWLTQGK